MTIESLTMGSEQVVNLGLNRCIAVRLRPAMNESEVRRSIQSRPIQRRNDLKNMHETRSGQLTSRCH